MVLRSYLDGRLFADAFSDAPPVIGLHGWERSRQDLTPIVERFHGASIDLPGFGASPEPPEPWGAEAYAALVAEAIEQLGTRPVVLGHSMGGRVAVCLAAARPELVSGLVLTGVPQLLRSTSVAKSPLVYRLVKRFHAAGLLSPAVLERQREKYGSADYRAARGVMRDVLVTMVNEDYRDQLGAISCPVEMVWGETDTAAPLAMAREAVSLITNGTLTVLPGIGHDTPHDAPAELIEAVSRALAVAA
jgi:pimeloyl-ACP methyl ester carboxylesterase